MQETYLRAWRAFHGFEQRSSVRTWMYRIATNTCLTALEGRSRRPMPTGLGQPASDPGGSLDNRPEVSWLEPLPDAVVWGRPTDDPAEEVVRRESIRLAFVAALQHLTPLQRAVLVLRDVLAWPASEVAEALDVSVAAANSALQRARAHVDTMVPEEDALVDERARDLLDGYVAAFERYDVDRIVELLTADATWEMPPYAGWYSGAEAIGTSSGPTVRPNGPATCGWCRPRRTDRRRSGCTCAISMACIGPFSSRCSACRRPGGARVRVLRPLAVRHLRAASGTSCRPGRCPAMSGRVLCCGPIWVVGCAIWVFVPDVGASPR